MTSNTAVSTVDPIFVDFSCNRKGQSHDLTTNRQENVDASQT